MRTILVSIVSVFLLISTAAWADPPEMSGAVIRFTADDSECEGPGDPWICCTGDGEGECQFVVHVVVDVPLFAITGVDLPGLEAWCDGDEGFLLMESVDSQWVLSPDGTIIASNEVDGDCPIIVYPVQWECLGGTQKDILCCHYEEFSPLASGRATFRALGNQSQWSRLYSGFLTHTATGELAPFSAHTHCAPGGCNQQIVFN